jgi:hypothetical protein
MKIQENLSGGNIWLDLAWPFCTVMNLPDKASDLLDEIHTATTVELTPPLRSIK